MVVAPLSLFSNGQPRQRSLGESIGGLRNDEVGERTWRTVDGVSSVLGMAAIGRPQKRETNGDSQDWRPCDTKGGLCKGTPIAFDASCSTKLIHNRQRDCISKAHSQQQVP
jgi:hypothetical protein